MSRFCVCLLQLQAFDTPLYMQSDVTQVAMQFQTFYFSSRTDSGVHALANSAHVTIIRRHRKTGVPLEEPYECSAIQAAINHRLRQQDYFCRVTHVRAAIPTTASHNIVLPALL
jgi:tRNA U38,U39,U40 pseudouridine synthase TruA